MADILDVLNALTTLAQSAVYPNGLTHPSVGNIPVRIYPGWPNPATLDADLAPSANPKYAHVNIYSTNISRISTRFDTKWQTISVETPTLTLTILNNHVTVGGTVTLPQACMVFVNGTSYSYGVKQNDTLNSIASGLALLIPNASATGAVITIGGTVSSIITKIIVSGTSSRELAREKRLVVVYVWAPTPQLRSSIGYAIQVLFAATYRVSLPDGYYGQLTYVGSYEHDDLEKPLVFRRDIHFIFEFATTQSETDYTIGDNNVTTTLSPLPL